MDCARVETVLMASAETMLYGAVRSARAWGGLLLRDMDQFMREQRESGLGVGSESTRGKRQVRAVRDGLRAPTGQKRIDGVALVQPDMPEIVAQGASEEFDQQGGQTVSPIRPAMNEQSFGSGGRKQIDRQCLRLALAHVIGVESPEAIGLRFLGVPSARPPHAIGS